MTKGTFWSLVWLAFAWFVIGLRAFDVFPPGAPTSIWLGVGIIMSGIWSAADWVKSK